MTQGKITYSPSLRLSFSKADIAVLLACSAAHYDGVCRAAGQRGGCVYGLSMHDHDPVDMSMDMSDIDLLGKITEVAPVEIREAAFNLHMELNAAYFVLDKAFREVNK